MVRVIRRGIIKGIPVTINFTKARPPVSGDIIVRLQTDLAEATADNAKHQRLANEAAETMVKITQTLGVLREMGYISGPAEPPTQASGPTPERQKMTGPEMIMEILDRPEFRNLGTTPAQIIQIIRSEYNPEFVIDNVRPTLWRLAKEGRIIKDDLMYKPLNENNIPSVQKDLLS